MQEKVKGDAELSGDGGGGEPKIAVRYTNDRLWNVPAETLQGSPNSKLKLERQEDRPERVESISIPAGGVVCERLIVDTG